jgi:hypothetical protein
MLIASTVRRSRGATQGSSQQHGNFYDTQVRNLTSLLEKLLYLNIYTIYRAEMIECRSYAQKQTVASSRLLDSSLTLVPWALLHHMLIGLSLVSSLVAAFGLQVICQ